MGISFVTLESTSKSGKIDRTAHHTGEREDGRYLIVIQKTELDQ